MTKILICTILYSPSKRHVTRDQVENTKDANKRFSWSRKASFAHLQLQQQHHHRHLHELHGILINNQVLQPFRCSIIKTIKYYTDVIPIWHVVAGICIPTPDTACNIVRLSLKLLITRAQCTYRHILGFIHKSWGARPYQQQRRIHHSEHNCLLDNTLQLVWKKTKNMQRWRGPGVVVVQITMNRSWIAGWFVMIYCTLVPVCQYNMHE